MNYIIKETQYFANIYNIPVVDLYCEKCQNNEYCEFYDDKEIVHINESVDNKNSYQNLVKRIIEQFQNIIKTKNAQPNDFLVVCPKVKFNPLLELLKVNINDMWI